MESIVTAPFDYSRLDEAGTPVRIRLRSSVVRVRHDGPPESASEVEIHYVRAGRSERVRARRCILACWNAVVPYLAPELPDAQRAALSSQVKVPLVYTNVLLRSWQAPVRLGLGAAHCPGRFHKLTMLDFPVSLGAVRFAQTPDEPIVMHLSSALTAPGLPPRDQHRTARVQLLAMTFETFEREIRTHLAGMLGGGGFDPARDIAGITVNRWPHGYAYSYNPLFDPDVPEDQRPNVVGRQRFGRIAIANSDAGGRAYLDCAIDEAHRAVRELET
jgi:spermidine dehydrogenase